MGRAGHVLCLAADRRRRALGRGRLAARELARRARLHGRGTAVALHCGCRPRPVIKPPETPMTRNLKEQWRVLSYYQRFESMVAMALTLIVALIVLVALYRLGASVLSGLFMGMLDPLDPKVFQAVFGEILTKVVMLIALLAIARKFIVLDLDEVSAGHLFGLAAVTLALAIGYWLICERDERLLRKS